MPESCANTHKILICVDYRGFFFYSKMKFYILDLCRRDKNMAVFTESQLKRLKAHKYCSEGRSISEFLFQPFWNYVVTLMPLWLAPNLITILGLIVNVFSSALILVYSPKADSDDVS